MNFEDWLKSKGYMDGYGTDYQDAYDEGFDEGVLSQQVEINKLKSKNVKLEILILQVQQSCGGCDSRDLLISELRGEVDDLIELNRLKTIALQQSVNKTSIHVHEKIIDLENKLKGRGK